MTDRVMYDRSRIHVLGMRMFARPMRDVDTVTYAEAKALALATLYDIEYREWRGKQLEALKIVGASANDPSDTNGEKS